MARVIEGTGQKQRFQVLKAYQGVKKARCMTCGELAIETPDGRGGLQLQCPQCKTVMKVTKLD